MFQIIKQDTRFPFVAKRRIAYAFSLFLIGASLISLIVHGGPRYGVEFAGGTEALIKFDGNVPIEKVKEALQAAGIAGASAQQYGKESADLYRILIAGDQAQSADLAKRLQEGLSMGTGAKASVESFEMVGPQVGETLREKAMLAIFFTMLMITIYISGRFELKWTVSGITALMLGLVVYVLMVIGLNIPIVTIVALVVSLILFWYLNLKYAMGAIVALLHDVIITVGIFSLLDKQFTLTVIAALLTIIGYSLNDTIIVFDRIRENLRKSQKQPMAETINKSINETLSRTILTAGGTLLMVMALLIWGGNTIQDFAFALLVGILVGTYSSIFVASPILLAWQKRK
ncbi:MAG: protein translocase subunit SecF [Desulfatitalea sp.]